LDRDETITPTDTPTSTQEGYGPPTLNEIQEAVLLPPKRTDTLDSVGSANSDASTESKATDITVPDEKPVVEKIMEKEPVRPGLDRSSSYFDPPKTGERPRLRRFQSMLERNAMANPGASVWAPTK
jgi:hypothetical protein